MKNDRENIALEFSRLGLVLVFKYLYWKWNSGFPCASKSHLYFFCFYAGIFVLFAY